MAALLLLAGSLRGQGDNALTLPLDIKPTQVHQDLEGQSVDLTLSGKALLTLEGETVRALLEITANLEDLQRKIAPIVQRRGEFHDECGERLQLHTVSLNPTGGAAEFFVAGHYERWYCAGLLGKGQLFEQSGSVRVQLTTRIQGDSTIAIDSKILEVQADGLLGDLLRDRLVGDLLRGEIIALLQSALNADRLALALPNELQPFHPVLQTSAFADLGGGKLGLRASGQLSGALQSLVELVKGRPDSEAGRPMP